LKLNLAINNQLFGTRLHVHAIVNQFLKVGKFNVTNNIHCSET